MRIIAVAAAVVVFSPPGAATQGIGSKNSELRVFTTRSIATVLEKIGADFERRTGRKLSVTTDVAVKMVRRINDGEQFDVLVAAPAQIDELIKAGKIIPETRTDLARSGIGVAVRAGAPKPDVSSVDAFKRALLSARSIAYLKEGQSGVYVAGVLERLGIAETIRSKVTLPETDIVSELVRRGEIELGIVVITQIMTTAGVALAGPLPSDIQSYITFTGGISANSKSIDAAQDLMTVLRSPVAIGVMRSQGMEPAAASGIARAQLPDTRKDEDAIRAIIGATTDAFRRHDAKAWVQHCTSDAELVTVRGESMRGVAQIEKGLATVFQTRGRNVTLKTLEVSVRFVRPDIALAHVKNELSGLIGPDGQTLPPHQELSVRVFVKNEGTWRITAFHNTIVQR